MGVGDMEMMGEFGRRTILYKNYLESEGDAP